MFSSQRGGVPCRSSSTPPRRARLLPDPVTQTGGRRSSENQGVRSIDRSWARVQASIASRSAVDLGGGQRGTDTETRCKAVPPECGKALFQMVQTRPPGCCAREDKRIAGDRSERGSESVFDERVRTTGPPTRTSTAP